jgi:hypothetical protein
VAIAVGCGYRAISLSPSGGVEQGVNTVSNRAYVALDENHNWREGDEALRRHENLFGEPVVEDVRGSRLWYEWDIPEDYMAKYVPHLRDKEDVPHEHAIPDFYGLGEAKRRERQE